MKIHNVRKLANRRKELRKSPTREEEKLWWYLKDKGLGVKFRRQHSIGGYILDFLCKEKKLIVEIDGGIHKTRENREYDYIRDGYFEELGYKTLRFWNHEVDENTKRVVDRIKEHLK